MEQAQVIATPPEGGAPKPVLKVNNLFYRGQTGALYGIWFSQLFLTILTLGIYSFWGKTRLRRYLIGAMELDGDRLEYLGTGKELFIGMLKILPFYFLVVGMMVGLHFIMEPEKAQIVGNLIILPLIVYLIPVASYSGFRYRVNRLAWRGVRGVMRGSAFAFGGKYLLGTLISILTLGFLIPKVDLDRWSYQIRNMAFGNVPFAFTGNTKNLNTVNIVTLLLFPFTLGFSRLWYMAALQREYLRGLSLGQIRFRSTATAGNFLGLFLGNIFILIFTLYLGTPLVMQRNMRFFEKHIAIGGDLASFNAMQAERGKAGDAEGLLDIMDVDIGMIGA
jgi:uncharacterized membrane protein YjgN (DUF898 family)